MIILVMSYVNYTRLLSVYMTVSCRFWPSGDVRTTLQNFVWILGGGSCLGGPAGRETHILSPRPYPLPVGALSQSLPFVFAFLAAQTTGPDKHCKSRCSVEYNILARSRRRLEGSLG